MYERSARGAHTLAAPYYTSEELFRCEMERIFLDGWMFVGHASRLPGPGHYFLFELGAESVVVLRDRGGQIRAFHNVCRHRGSRLCAEAQGRLEGPLRCPYHAWTYDHDGRLIGAPNMAEVPGFDKKDHPLAPVAVTELDGLLFLNLASEPEPASSYFAPLTGRFGRWQIPELEVHHEEVYEVDANWKLFFQNYSECYHCPGVHPHLNQLTPFRHSFNDLEEGPFLGGPMRLAQGPGGSMTLSGQACSAPLAGIEGDGLGLVYYYTIFPNFFLSLHPDYVLAHRCQPLAVDRTRIVCQWWFHPSARQRPGCDPADAVGFWHLTNTQDWELCANTQLGVASRGYRPGPYSNLESQLAAFDRHYLETLGDTVPEARRSRTGP